MWRGLMGLLVLSLMFGTSRVASAVQTHHVQASSIAHCDEDDEGCDEDWDDEDEDWDEEDGDDEDGDEEDGDDDEDEGEDEDNGPVACLASTF